VLAIAITGTTVTAAHAAPSTSDLTKKIDKASDDLEDVTESYNKMRIDLKATMAAEKKLAASLKPAQEALDAASAQVGNIATTSYMQGRVGPLNVLVSGSETGLMERMSFLEQIARSNQRDIDAYTETTLTYAERQDALEATRAKQDKQVKELGARKAKIEKDLKKLLAMRKAAYGKPQETGSPYTGAVPDISGKAGAAVRFAYAQIGKPYSYGADGPNSYDCSGLTSKAWAAAGESLPHNAAAQYSATARVSRSDLAPGDLVFYRSLGHVAIYVGDGQVIDAPRTGSTVSKRTINLMTPYGYGRIR